MFETNKISKLLNIKYPILQGGMAWASDSKLACAVSDAGGLGIIGCGGRKSEWVLNEIDNAKRITSQATGLNFPLEGMSDKEAEYIIESAFASGKKIFTVSGSNSYLRFLSKYGDDILIIPVIGNVMEAKLAERTGAKAVICEGQESGGSIGRLSLFSLLPQVVDAVEIPVIAAGGIADSRGMRAAFALGAQGIQMGTRFLASEECRVIEEYKKRILKAKDIDSIVIFNKVKYPARVIKNKFAMEYLSKERDDTSQEELIALGKGSLKLAVESDVDLGAMHAGEISGLITDIKSAREIIEDIVLGYSNDNYECANDNEVIDTEVSKYLKHKPPILLVEKILDLEPGIECKASLKLSKDKWISEKIINLLELEKTPIPSTKTSFPQGEIERKLLEWGNKKIVGIRSFGTTYSELIINIFLKFYDVRLLTIGNTGHRNYATSITPSRIRLFKKHYETKNNYGNC